MREVGELAYTCTPPGSEQRVGIDRDEDGVLVGDEEDGGSDPADATSAVRAGGGGDAPTSCLVSRG